MSAPTRRRLARRAPAATVARAVLAIATLALAAASRAQEPSPPPPIPGAPIPHAIAQDPVWDAGTVAAGAQVGHEFVLRNDGPDTIFLREVRPSCGCTVVSFDPSMPPGGSAHVRATVDTGAFRGGIAKDLTVFTSDPGNPSLLLTVKAVVRPPVDALPGYYRFRHLQGQPAESMAQTVWATDRPDFRITGVQSPSKSITVTVHAASPAERRAEGTDPQFVVVATLAADAPLGPLAGDVIVHTNDARQGTLAIPLVGDVRPLVALVPPVVDLGTFEHGEPRRASLIVSNNGTAPIDVLGVETDVPGLTVKLAPEGKAGKRWDVALTLAADAPKGPLAGTIRVRTSAATQPLLEARVVGTVR